jgi:uncharacterized protein YdhG (YjbR/CyaY superfamily)
MVRTPERDKKKRLAKKGAATALPSAKEAKPRPATVAEYLAATPTAARARLRKLRAIVRRVAPSAIESLSYGMPAYKLEGRPLVYYAAFKAHIGIYALPSGHVAFAKELAGYKQGRGSVQFPLAAPMPYALIERLVAFRVREVCEASPKRPSSRKR